MTGDDNQLLIARYQAALSTGRPVGPDLLAGLDRMFAREQDRIYGLCLKIVRAPARAEELAQEAMITAWRRLPEFEGRSRFSTWLFGIARNHCFNAVRKKADLLSDDGVVEPNGAPAVVLRTLRRQEREALVLEAVAELGEQEQEVVYLRYVEDLAYGEIDRALGLDGSGARAILQRCRRKLARSLDEALAAMGQRRSFLLGSAW